jgi:hypothetical protein
MDNFWIELQVMLITTLALSNIIAIITKRVRRSN